MDYASIFAALPEDFKQITAPLNVDKLHQLANREEFPLPNGAPETAVSCHTDYFPMLYKRTKSGNIAWYDISVTYYPAEGIAVVDYTKASGIGYKSQHDFGEYNCGVNIGKRNETSYAEQAFFDAQSAIRKLKDQGYKEGIPAEGVLHNTDADGDAKPMLAQSYNEDKPNFPYLIQPKLNGVRCNLVVTDNGVVKTATLKSRGGKFYTVPHHIAQSACERLPAGSYDGEIYRHGWKLQRITAAVKKLRDDTYELEFWCYDTTNTVQNNGERAALISTLFSTMLQSAPLKWCPTYRADNQKQVDLHTKRFIKEGYEGAMLRNPEGLYRPGFRSKDLLKLKFMHDAEFKIVGVNSAAGRNEGCAVFVCEQNDGSGKTFNANPEGTLEYRRELYKNRKKCIGKFLTVRYQELSEEGTPIFPVGVVIRDYE